ncbi:uncharacterized protein LOC113133355 isoform X1 [Mastacembelus armatus]|uniref:uncharacterized protein LOC113133355 isoform X1 n=1 Tax=Mastacembelus armatus TaxID=205130 RepID=UPI000E4590E9|nr:uncharacterized protein LOC113133355 isoform X1 [Mastacembelus armatus]XP_026167907.1 uncharacterized protein LOC113133355 isoform X1 [Mastacembelus armatus]
MPAGVSWSRYLRMLGASVLAMFAGAQVVHQYYLPDLSIPEIPPKPGELQTELQGYKVREEAVAALQQLKAGEKLEQIKISQQNAVKGPNLFNNSNLDAIFGIMDPSNRRYITLAQYKQALITLGIKNINECPEGANEDRISHDTFKTEAMQGLQTC